MKTRYTILILFAFFITFFQPTALRASSPLDSEGWTRWVSFEEVASMVSGWGPKLFVNDVDVRTSGGYAEYRLQWIQPIGKYFDLRVLNTMEEVNAFREARRRAGWTLVKGNWAYSSGNGAMFWVGLWHK